jgi:hypothetical protein
VTTIVIPAHNEDMVIGRLLTRLVSGAPDPAMTVIVVANGCTDQTAQVAASFGPRVQVISLPKASKHDALAAGDRVAPSFPRIYLDADVELGRPDVAALAAELGKPGVLAAAPDRRLTLQACAWPVRWYYDVWTRLPEVRGGLFGRGAIAVNEAGHQRIAGLPALLADDLAASLSFKPGERSIARGARVTCHPPRTTADLLRRRIRVATGVAQIERGGGAPASTARTHLRDVALIGRSHPRMAQRVALFLLVTAVARWRARRAASRGDFTTWQRDESSRAGAAAGGAAVGGAAAGGAAAGGAAAGGAAAGGAAAGGAAVGGAVAGGAVAAGGGAVAGRVAREGTAWH